MPLFILSCRGGVSYYILLASTLGLFRNIKVCNRIAVMIFLIQDYSVLVACSN